jgi:hypothetical protein
MDPGKTTLDELRFTHIPNIKSISQSIAKKSGDNGFI